MLNGIEGSMFLLAQLMLDLLKIRPTEAASTSQSSTPNAWPRRASSPPWAVSAIATTTRWPRRSMASTRPKSSNGVDRGDRSRRSSSPPSNGWIGSTTGGSWSPSATSRRPKPRSATTPYWKSPPWRRDSNQTASGKPGAVQDPWHLLPPLKRDHPVSPSSPDQII